MSRFRQKNQKNYSGFTLIELLVVITVIGLLASVILVSLNNSRIKARDTKRVADIHQLQVALALYYNSNNSYPNNLNSLVPTYLLAVPLPPTGTSQAAYRYARYGASPNVTYYHLGALLEQAKTNSNLPQRNCRSGANANGAPPQCVTGTNATANGFNGARNTCLNSGAAPDICYDVTP